MPFARLRILCALALAVLALPALAQTQTGAGAPALDPLALLQAAKTVTGGNAWDAFATQRSTVRLTTGGMTGKVERWVDIKTGRSYLKFAVGPLSGTQGFDGNVAWSQDGSGQTRAETAPVAKELAVNAAYRDKLAFWYPERGKAAIAFKGHVTAGAQGYEVVTLTPEGGRPFEFWINSDNRVIERLVESEGDQTRTELYSDFRGVQGVKLPFHVRAMRGQDIKQEEIVNVEKVEFNASLDGIAFGLSGLPPADWTFPEGRKAVDVPIELANGHMYVQAKINGKGPFRLLLDIGGVNVLVPEVAEALGLVPEGRVPAAAGGAANEYVELAKLRSLDIGGITLTDQLFAVIPLRAYGRRIEGVELDGLVGYELFMRFPGRIDYEKRQVTFYEPAAFRYTGKGTRLPYRFNGNVPQVEATLDGIPGVFDLDTGARSSLTLAGPYWKAHKLDAKYGAKQEVIAGAGLGGAARAMLGRAGSFKLGDVEIKAPIAMLSTAAGGTFTEGSYAGTVGYGVLHRFNLVLDYPHEQLFVEPNAAAGTPDVHDRAGLWIERVEKGFQLIEVVPGGPGAQAGLNKGDLVVAVDGVDFAEIRLPELRERMRGAAGTNVRLKLAVGGERTVTLKDLI